MGARVKTNKNKIKWTIFNYYFFISRNIKKGGEKHIKKMEISEMIKINIAICLHKSKHTAILDIFH